MKIFLNENCLIYFLIGVIDGDGYIGLSYTKKKGTRKNLIICSHSSWYDTWIIIKNKCSEYYGITMSCKIHDKGYVKIGIYDTKSHKTLINYLNNIPYMKRKWDKLKNYYDER